MSALSSSPTPAKGELSLNRTIPSATAEASRTAPTAGDGISPTPFELEQIALEEGIDYFSAQGALAAHRMASHGR